MFLNSDKQGYIFENCDGTFFNNPLYANVFRIAKDVYTKRGIVSNVDVVAEDTRLNETVTTLMIEPPGFASMISVYCRKLYEQRLNELIAQSKTEKDIAYIQDFKQKYATLDYKVKHISSGADKARERYYKGRSNLMSTGYVALDEKIGSFMGGDYIALGGGTGMGKTAIALNIANMLCMQDKKVLYFSLEMPLEQLQSRFVCMVMGLECHKFRSFDFTEEEMDTYIKGLNGLKEWNLDIVCDFNLTPEKMKIYAENQKKKGLDFIILDYLGLMNGYGNKSLYEKATNISRQIKLIATELEVPILVLVQLNRDLKNRPDKRPILPDIRESGAIEQDADFVLFAYRDCVYNSDSDPNELEIIIAKNRHGESNTVAKLDFDLKTQVIRNVYQNPLHIQKELPWE